MYIYIYGPQFLYPFPNNELGNARAYIPLFSLFNLHKNQNFKKRSATNQHATRVYILCIYRIYHRYIVNAWKGHLSNNTLIN